MLGWEIKPPPILLCWEASKPRVPGPPATPVLHVLSLAHTAHGRISHDYHIQQNHQMSHLCLWHQKQEPSDLNLLTLKQDILGCTALKATAGVMWVGKDKGFGICDVIMLSSHMAKRI